jgi:predicted nuclease of predicted toxin-antitoxin system
MRILLDENFPTDFAKQFPGHEVHTVHSLGWSGIKNGELLRRANAVCDVFVTLDKNLEFQQNIEILPFGIVVVRASSNRMVHLVPFVTDIVAAATRVSVGEVARVGG